MPYRCPAHFILLLNTTHAACLSAILAVGPTRPMSAPLPDRDRYRRYRDFGLAALRTPGYDGPSRRRAEHFATQQQLADALGVAQQTLAHYEGGRSRLPALAQLLTLSFDELMGQPVNRLQQAQPDVATATADRHHRAVTQGQAAICFADARYRACSSSGRQEGEAGRKRSAGRECYQHSRPADHLQFIRGVDHG